MKVRFGFSIALRIIIASLVLFFYTFYPEKGHAADSNTGKGKDVNQVQKDDDLEKIKKGRKFYKEIRAKAMATKPGELNIKTKSGTEAYGVFMEIGFPNGVATLVAWKNGEASIYFSNGGGVFGGGQYKVVRKQAKKFVSTANGYVKQMKHAIKTPGPKAQKIIFYLLTRKGILSAGEIDEVKLSTGNHVLAPLFEEGNNLITELRVLSEKKTRGGKTD